MKGKTIGLLIFALVFFNSGMLSVVQVYAQAYAAPSQTITTTIFYPDVMIDPVPSIFLHQNDINFTVRNIGQRTLTEQLSIQFQWISETGDAVGLPLLYTHTEPLEQAQPHSTLASGAIAYVGPSLRFSVEGKPAVAAYVSAQNKPFGATGIRVTLDPSNQIGELNETNNSASAPQNPLVDFEVKGVSFETLNGYRAMKVNVKNNGTDPVVFTNQHMPRISMAFIWLNAQGNMLQWYSSDLQRSVLSGIQNMTVPGPGAEAETVVYMTEWSANGVLAHPPVEAASLKIVLDDARAIREPNEDDNTLIVPFAQLELVPDIFIDPVNQIRLQPDQLRFTMRNIGQRPVTEPFDVMFQWVDASGAPVGPSKIYTHTTGLGVAEVFRRFTNGGVVFTGGEYVFDSNEHPDVDDYILAANKPAEATRFVVTLDPANALAEINESNNSDSTVQDPLVDLVVRDVRTETVNGRYALVVTVANVGGNRDPFPANNRAPRVSFVMRWLDAQGRILTWVSPDSGRQVNGGIQQFSPPRGGEAVDVTVYALPSYADGFFQTIPAAAASMKIDVDDAARFNEEREDNNSVTVPLESIPLAPDLYLDTVRGGVLYPDELAFTLRNIGQRTVTEQITMEFQWVDAAGAPVGAPYIHNDDKDISVASVSGRYADGSPMYSGASYIFSSNAFPELDAYVHYTNKPAGAAKLRVSIDPANTITELVKNNATQLLQQGPVIDVAIVGARTEMTDRGYALVFTATNVGLEEDTMQGGSRRSVGLQWLDARGNVLSWVSSRTGRMETAAITELPSMRPGEVKEGIVYATEGSAEGFFLRKPESAVAVRFEADDARRYSEPNEENNIFVFHIDPPEEEGEEMVEADEEMIEEELAEVLAEAPEESAEELTEETIEEPVVAESAEENVQVEVSAEQEDSEQVELPSGEVIDVPPADATLTPAVEPPPTIETTEVVYTAEEELPQIAAQDPVEPTEPVVQPESASPAPRPSVLPGSWRYPFKEAGRSLRLLATFDDKKEAELHLKYSSERALEMSELVDNGDTNEAAKATKKYEKQLTKLAQSLEELKKEDPQAAKKVEHKAVRQELLQQALLGKVEREASSQEVTEVKEVRDHALKLLGEKVVSLSDGVPEKTQKLFEGLSAPSASPLGAMRTIEVLQAVADKVQNEEAGKALQTVIDNKVERLAKEFNSQQPEQQKKLSTYLEHAGGDEVGYLKIVQELKNESTTAQAAQALGEAENGVVATLEKRVEEMQNNKSNTDILFVALEGDSFEDLQVIKKLEEQPKLKEATQEVKEQAFEAFVNVLRDTPTQGTPTQGTPTQGAWFTPTQGKPTLKDLKILTELKGRLAPEEKKLVERVEQETIVKLQKEAIEERRNILLEVPVVETPTQGTPTQGTPTQGTPTQGLVETPTQGKPTVETPTQGKVETPTQGKVETPTQGKPVIETPKVTLPKATVPKLVVPVPKPEPVVEAPKPEPKPEPVACTMEWAPVCGTDGVTYSNACTAKAAGVEVSYEEECITVTYTKSAEMEITNKGFNPFVVDVEAGGVVTFTNNNEFTVTLHIDGFGHPIILSVGKTFEYTSSKSKGIFKVRAEVGQVGAKDLSAIIVTH